MAIILLQNEFCSFPWSSRLKWDFHCDAIGAAKTIVLGAKGSAVHGLFQIWDLTREPERSLPGIQKDRLLAVPGGFPPGIVREYIETEGQFSTWYGVSNKGVPHSSKLLDYELMSEAGTLAAYVRRSTKEPHEHDLARELSLIAVRPYDRWIAGLLALQ